jgi:hypothetical protein
MRDRHRFGVRRHGYALGAAHLDPAVLQLGELEQRLERRLVDAVLARHATHVVDDERHRQRAHHRRQRHDAGGIEMQHHVPAAALDAVDDTVEHGHVGGAAEMLDEIEAHAAHAAFVELVEIGLAEAVVDDGDAAIALGIGGDAVEHRLVVDAVAARLHDHRARDAEMAVQRAQHFLGASSGV